MKNFNMKFKELNYKIYTITSKNYSLELHEHKCFKDAYNFIFKLNKEYEAFPIAIIENQKAYVYSTDLIADRSAKVIQDENIASLKELEIEFNEIEYIDFDLPYGKYIKTKEI